LVIFVWLKKLVSITVLSIFLFNLGGFFIVFNFQQVAIRKEIKKQIKEGVPEDELTIITQTSENFDEIVWIKPKKEFTYKGTMYDVVRKTVEDNGDITYHCINDTQETTLFVNLDNLVKKNMDARNNGKDSIKLLFQSLYFSNDLMKINFSTNEKKVELFIFYSSYYLSPDLYVLAPPPKLS